MPEPARGESVVTEFGHQGEVVFGSRPFCDPFNLVRICCVASQRVFVVIAWGVCVLSNSKCLVHGVSFLSWRSSAVRGSLPWRGGTMGGPEERGLGKNRRAFRTKPETGRLRHPYLGFGPKLSSTHPVVPVIARGVLTAHPSGLTAMALP